MFSYIVIPFILFIRISLGYFCFCVVQEQVLCEEYWKALHEMLKKIAEKNIAKKICSLKITDWNDSGVA